MKAKKIVRVIVLVLLLTLLAPISVVPTNVIVAKAATIKISKAKLSLEKGKTSTLKITGTKASVKWTSNKKTVATVSKVGKVKAIKAGTATITASVKGKKYNCKVTVTDKSANKANNLDILNLTVKMPKNWIYEDLFTLDGVAMGIIKPKSAKTAGVVVIGMDTGEKVDTNEMLDEILKELKASSIVEDTFAMAFSSGDITNVKVKNAKIKKYNSKVGKTIKIDCEMSFKINGKNKKMKLPLYIMLYKNYVIEFVGVDYDNELKTSIDQTMQDILNAVKVKK